MQPIRRSTLRALAAPASSFKSTSRGTRSFATFLQSSSPCTSSLTRPQRSALLASHLRRSYATGGSEPGTTTESVKAAANETADAAKDTAQSAKETAQSATEKTKRNAESAADSTKQAGEGYAQEAGSSTRNSASDIMGSASNSAQTASQAARDTATSTAGAMREGIARAGESVADAARGGSGVGLGAASSAQTSPIRSEPTSGTREKPDAEASTNLYIGNLYFEVSKERLQKEFEKFGELKSCRVISDARGMSKGFGYIDFANASAADEARARLDGQVFEGRRLVVQFAIKPRHIRQNPDDPNSFVNPPSKTLFIGNLSYEMTDKDLNALFKEVQNVLDVRVAIDRRTGQPRGFAHADFIDVKSAEAGAEFLRSKEFYGRRLRVDFSSSGGGR